LLVERSDWSVARLATMQTDVESLWARELVGTIGGDLSGDAAEAARALRGWNGAMNPEGPSALFALFERELLRDVFEDEATRAGLARFGTRKRLAALVEGRIGADWWDDVSTAAKEDRAQVVARALAEAWHRGAARWGSDVAAWRYADLHQLTLDHPLGGLPLLGRWFRRGPFGSATTIEAFGGPWRGEAIAVTYGASMRFVTDAAEPERTVAILPGGQAGHPADAHYADQLSLYFSGGARPVAWSDAEVERAVVSRLRLEPPGGSR
jgi:penicillin amidase